MPRKSPIKWRKSDVEKLTKEIERFNAKIYRTRARHPERSDILPETIKKEDKEKLIKELQNAPRSEFNKKLRSLERFARKEAEKPIESKTGNVVSQWEKKEIGYKIQQINRERAKERKRAEEMDATSRGKELGLKRGEMGSERLNELRPKKFNFNKIKKGKEWEKFKASVEKQSSWKNKIEKMELYKQNYIQGLKNAFGEHANEIIEIVEKLPADVVVDTYYREQEATITFFYEKQAMGVKLDVLENIWLDVEANHDETNR